MAGEAEEVATGLDCADEAAADDDDEAEDEEAETEDDEDDEDDDEALLALMEGMRPSLLRIDMG